MTDCHCHCDGAQNRPPPTNAASDADVINNIKKVADTIVKIKDVILAFGVIIALILMVKTAALMTGGLQESAKVLGSTVATIGAKTMGSSLTDVLKEKEREQLGIAADHPELVDTVMNSRDALKAANQNVSASL